MTAFDIIVAATASTFGIGRAGGLPWRLRVDMAFFKRVTTLCDEAGKQNAVIMGRKTYESIPSKFRPLDNRVNVVISRNPSIREELAIPDNVMVASSLPEALELLENDDMQHRVSQVFVIGGGSIYDEAVKSEHCKRVFMTTVHSDQFEDCDTHFPSLAADTYTLTA
eukprot:CAMPEP_0119500804 /NCGR_PEP_ID=MMETSP1344-20130328/22834_1 /TAXON_ID=236787 /ORGANISM="Florenciella parvula, Strain CCMP2471" /LENGTH=166 /DNA_ID=CAMNT_0007536921 /DNA_START=12 /DNA_END=509 /DNA_ORIENTATION=-